MPAWSSSQPARREATPEAEDVPAPGFDLYRFSDGHVVYLKGEGPTPARFLLGRSGKALEAIADPV